MATDPSPPLLRPAHDAPPPAPTPLTIWMSRHAAGLAALAIGAVAFVVVTLRQDRLWATPDWRVTVPLFTAALVAAVVSLARREGSPILPLAGVGLAAIALALGWFLVMAIIVAVTAILILILSMVM